MFSVLLVLLAPQVPPFEKGGLAIIDPVRRDLFYRSQPTKPKEPTDVKRRSNEQRPGQRPN